MGRTDSRGGNHELQRADAVPWRNVTTAPCRTVHGRDASTIIYELTVTDPVAFTRPWEVENALRKSDAMIYESNCHEGNYALANILSAARAEENKK